MTTTDVAALPAQRTTGAYRIGMVCLGNICRSPVADVVMTAKVADAGLSDLVEVASCGTADWHVGKHMDSRSAATLTGAGYDPTRHRAQQFGPSWLDEYDLLLTMDLSNLADVGGRTDHVRLFRDFDPAQPGSEVPDPYYGGEQGFGEVLEMVERTCDTLVDLLRSRAGRDGDAPRP